MGNDESYVPAFDHEPAIEPPAPWYIIAVIVLASLFVWPFYIALRLVARLKR